MRESGEGAFEEQRFIRRENSVQVPGSAPEKRRAKGARVGGEAAEAAALRRRGRQAAAGGGYNDSDSWMRNLYIKVSGNAASSVCTKRSLYIKGLSGGFDYEIYHAGTSTPAGNLTSV